MEELRKGRSASLEVWVWGCGPPSRALEENGDRASPPWFLQDINAIQQDGSLRAGPVCLSALLAEAWHEFPGGVLNTGS